VKLGQRRPWVWKPVKGLGGDHCVEGGVAEGKPHRVALDPDHVGGVARCLAQHAAREVATDHARRCELALQPGGEQAGAAADIEHAFGPYLSQNPQHEVVPRAVGETLHHGPVVEERPQIEEASIGAPCGGHATPL
jgi:hypothetical protein